MHTAERSQTPHQQLNLCLQDFVRLAKWEDRGYYAMKATTERNQRQLHRLTRRAEEALSQPAAAVLAAASKAMGFADLTTASSESGLKGAEGAQGGKAAKGSKRKAVQRATPEEVWAWKPCVVCLVGMPACCWMVAAPARSSRVLSRSPALVTVSDELLLRQRSVSVTQARLIRPLNLQCTSGIL